ncbi:hypothetical protein B4U79_03256, partial [Dinothrombium tinctorium]
AKDVIADDDVYDAIKEICLNVLKGKVPLKSKRHMGCKNTLECFAHPPKVLRLKKNRRKVVSQIGNGFWAFVIPAIVSLFAERLADKAIKSSSSNSDKSKMDSVRKMVVVPYEQQTNNEPQHENFVQQSISQPSSNISNEKRKKLILTNNEKLLRMVKIVLRLASINGYDYDGRIRSKKGLFIDRSNIITLLNHAMSIGHPLIGEQEFIELLREAKVDPSLIINENVKTKLANNYVRDDYENIPKEPRITSKIVDIAPVVKSRKRKFDEAGENVFKENDDENENLLEDFGWEIPLYYDPTHPASFASIEKLYNFAKEKFPNVNKDEIKDWLSEQLTYTLHKQARKRFKRNKLLVSHIDEQWQADLPDMREVSSENKGFKYILTIIDIFSKYAWAVPIKNKQPDGVIKVFKKIFEERKPLYLQTDKGKEFVNQSLKRFLKSNGVNHFVSFNTEIKCAVVERFNRTLKSKIYKYFTFNNTNNYVDVLQNLLNSYNNSVHRITKFKPVDISIENEKKVFFNIYGKPSKRDVLKLRQEPKLQKGDNVRVSRYKKQFDRGYLPQWTEEFFTIQNALEKSEKPHYVLKDEAGEEIEGKFYPEEVQRIKVTPNTTYRIERILNTRRGRRTEYFVKWIGFPDSSNS